MRHHEKVVKKGAFKVAYSRAKKNACENGELILTQKTLRINCGESWSRSLRNKEIRLEVWNGELEVHDSWYGKLLFRLIVDEAEQWIEAFREVTIESSIFLKLGLFEVQRRRQEELKRLFDIDNKALKRIYNEVRKEKFHFGTKSVKFSYEIIEIVAYLKNRKLRAFVSANSYVAWYEWTKRLLNKIYKARFGKRPKNDEELIQFLEDYPTLEVLDTKEWEIEANQIRNCVAHGRFYYDYRLSELVFIVQNKERRVRLRELQYKLFFMIRMYARLVEFLRYKVTGEMSYENIFA